MSINDSVMVSLQKLCSKRECFVIIDQLDSVIGTDLYKYFFTFIQSLAGLSNLRMLIIIRTQEYINSPEIKDLNFTVVESKPIEHKITRDFLAKLGIKNPSSELLQLSTNFLYLSLIAQINQEKNTEVVSIFNSVTLWKSFFRSYQSIEGEEKGNYLLELALETIKNRERTFNISYPFSKNIKSLINWGILIEDKSRRYAFRHYQMAEFLGAYSLQPRNIHVYELINLFGKKINRNIIKWLHLLYRNDDFNKSIEFFDEVLDSSNNLTFYSRVTILDNFKDCIDPTLDETSVLNNYLKFESYSSYFFKDLKNPHWFELFYTSEFFNNAPNIKRVGPNSFQTPFWSAESYLLLNAKNNESSIIDLVKEIKSDNFQVNRVLLKALSEISPKRISEVLYRINDWLDYPFSDMLVYDLIDFTKKLIEENDLDEAIEILNYVTIPKIFFPDEKETLIEVVPQIFFRGKAYWVNEFYENIIPKLLLLNPIKVLNVFEKQLDRFYTLAKTIKPDDTEKWVGFYWRLSLNKEGKNRNNPNSLDLLIDGLIEALFSICQIKIVEGKEILERYIFGDHILLKRMGMYVLKSLGENFPELINKVLLKNELIENRYYVNGYQGILKEQFGVASPEVRKHVIDYFMSLVKISLDEEEKFILNFQTEPENDQNEKDEHWLQFHLELIRNYLNGEPLELLDFLTHKNPKIDINLDPPNVTSFIGGAPSPLSISDIKTMSFTEIKQFLISFNPDDLFMNPRESLGTLIQGVIMDDPDYFMGFANYLCDESVRFVYIYNFLLGVREAVRKNNVKLSKEIIELCEFVINIETDPFISSSGRHEPGLLAAQLEVAHLLESALFSRDPYLSLEQLGIIKSILIKLSSHQDPNITEIAKSAFDPFTESFNCVRGLTMHALIQYSLYVVRQKEANEGKNIDQGYLEPEIQKLFTEKMDKNCEPSLGVHSVFGAFLPQLAFLSTDWFDENLPKILPDNPEEFDFWKAAWDAYIFASNVYKKIFIKLIPHYQKGLRLLSETQNDQKYLGGSPNERFAQHIMFAYISQLTDFDCENKILDLFFENAPDIIRSNGILWLSEVLENNKENSFDELWQRCFRLWKKRIDIAVTQEITDMTQEISEYMRWLKSCPEELSDLYEILQKSIKYLHDSYDYKLISDYVSIQSEKYPFEAVNILLQLINNAKEPWWHLTEECEEKIIKNAVESNNNEAKEIAEEVINIRGEQGDYRWKKYLDFL